MRYGADDLLSHGIRYLAAGRGDTNAHHKLAWAVRGQRQIPLSIWDGVRSELDASRETVNVISSEALWFADPAGVKNEIGEREDVRIVMYLRRQDKYLQSLYKQAVTSGRRTDFPTWLGEMSFRGDYLSVVRKWAEQFGDGAIVVRPYERAGKAVDTVSDFFQILGFDLQTVLPIRKHTGSNPSPRRELLDLIRAFNHVKLDIDYDAFFWSLIRRDPDFIRSTDLLSFEECEALMSQFEESNRMLSQTYYRDDETPLFPTLAAFSPPELWTPDQPEYFDMLVNMMNAVVDTLSTEGIRRKPSKPSKMKPGKKTES